MVECCQLVGNFPLVDIDGIISISISSSTETAKIGSNLIIGPTIGTLSLSGYAKDVVHSGCPGKAGVQVNWIRKWDCDNNIVYFIPAGAGKSFISGDVMGLATIGMNAGSYKIISASASSGPAGIYTDDTQRDGYGLSYSGNPISFGDSDGFTWGGVDVGIGKLYLQSFNLECNPGAVPTASYSFVFVGVLPD